MEAIKRLLQLIWSPRVGNLVFFRDQTLEITEVLEEDAQLVTNKGVFWEQEVQWEPQERDLEEVIDRYPVKRLPLKQVDGLWLASATYDKQFFDSKAPTKMEALLSLMAGVHQSASIFPEIARAESEMVLQNS